MKFRAALAIFAFVSLQAHAGMNKWVDSDGTVHYSDTLPPGVTKAETVRNVVGKDQPGAATSNSPKSIAEQEADLKKAKQEKDVAAKKQAQKDQEAAAKKSNCEAAQQNVRTLEQGSRIATYDENGERSYLDDNARAQRLEEARKAVTENCN